MADVNWGALLDADPRLQAPLRSRGLRIRPTVAPSVDWGAMLDAEAEQEMERPAPQQQAPLPPPPQSRQQPAPQPAPQPKAIEYQGTIYEFSPDWDDAKIVDWFTNSQYSPMKQSQQAPAQQQFAAPALQTQAAPQQPAMTPELEQAKQTYLSLLDKIESGQPASKEEYDALHRTAAVLDSAGVSEQAVFAGRKQPVWNPPQVESGPKTPIETEQQKHQKRLESGSKAALSFAREELAKSWFPNLRAVSESAHNEWISLAKRAVGKDQEADYSQVIADAWGQAADEIAQGGMVPAALERGMRNVLRVLPDMVVAGQVAGPYGALGLAGVQEGNRAITKGRKAGLSGGKLGTYVATQAGLEFAIGAVLQRAGLGGTETMAAAKQIAAKSLSDAGKQLAKTTGQELLEEIPTELSHNVADWAYNVDPTAMSMEQLGQTLTDTIIGTVMQSGAVSIPNVAGGAMAGRAARLEKLKGVQAKGFVSEQDAKDLGLPPEASTNRKTRGAAVKDEINQLEQEIKDAESVAAGVPTDASGVQGTTQMGVVPGEDGLPPAAGVPGAGTVTTPPTGVPPAVEPTTTPAVPPTGAEQTASEQAGLEGEGTGLERLGEAGAAIVDNFYDAILQSIKTTWRVPEQERNSAIGAAWRRARGKMTPEEFVDQLRTQGPDSIFPAKEVSDAVKEQEAAQVHAGDSALVAPEPGQAPRAEEEGAEVPIGVENRTLEGFQVAKQQANDARDNKPLLKWAVENLQPGDTFVNSLDGTRYTVTSVTVSDDKRQVYIESENVAIGDEGVVGGGTISVSKDGKITTAGDPTSAMHDTPYTTTEGMSGVATVGFEPSKSLPVNTDVTTLGNYVQRQNKPFDSPRRVRKVVYRNNGETRVFVEGESVAVKADELQPVRQEAGGQIPGQEQGKEAEVPDLDAAKELAGEGETSAEGTESSAAKEPWMMTREQFVATTVQRELEQGNKSADHPVYRKDLEAVHASAVWDAVSRGEELPADVAAQYANAEWGRRPKLRHPSGKQPWELTRDEWESGDHEYFAHGARESHNRLRVGSYFAPAGASIASGFGARGVTYITGSTNLVPSIAEGGQHMISIGDVDVIAAVPGGEDVHRYLVQKAMNEGLIESHPDYPDMTPRRAPESPLAAVPLTVAPEPTAAPEAAGATVAGQETGVVPEAEAAIADIDMTTRDGERQAMKAVKEIADKYSLNPNELWREVVFSPEAAEKDIVTELATKNRGLKVKPSTPSGPMPDTMDTEADVREAYEAGQIDAAEVTRRLAEIRAKAPPVKGTGLKKPAGTPKPELAPDTARIQAEKEAKEAAKREQQERVTSEGYAKLPEKSRTRFDAAWDGDDAQAMKALLDPSNKALRAEFERRAGVKLPRTIKGTGEAVDQVYAGRKPAAAPVAPAANAETPAKSLGELATASSEARAKYDHYSTLAGQVGRGKLTLKQALDQAKVYPDGQAAKTKKDIIALAERSKQELVTADEAYKAASAAIPPRSAADIAAERAEESRRQIAEHDAEIKRNGEEEQERKRKEDQDRLKLARPVLQALETVEPAKGGVRDENGYATNRASPIFREAIDGKFTTAQLSEARLRLMSAGAPSAAIDAVESATPISEAPKAKSEKKSTPIEVYAGDDIRYVNSGGQEFTGTVKQFAPTGKNLLVVPDGANNSIEISPDKVVGVDRRGKVSQQKGLAPDVVIGPKSHSNPDVERILKREQDAGRPAWYDGSYFYLKAGKYQLRTDDNGKTHFEQLHNLSEEGQMRHFDPSEYVSYNRVAAEKRAALDAADAEKQRIAAEKQAADEAAYQKKKAEFEDLDAKMKSALEGRTVKGKKQEIKIKLADGKKTEPVKATVYGNLAVHKVEKGGYMVASVPAQMNITSFETAAQAKEFVRVASMLSDFAGKSSKDFPNELVRLLRRAADYAKGQLRSVDSIEDLRALLDAATAAPPPKPKGRKPAAKAKGDGGRGTGGGAQAQMMPEGAEPGMPTDFEQEDGPEMGALDRTSESAAADEKAERLKIQPVPTVELVQLIRDILGSVPGVKKLRKYLGYFKSAKGSNHARIVINAIAGKDENLLAKVLAHEAGHMIDWLPDNTLDRGNILGRIGTLRNYLKHWLEGFEGGPGPLTDKERARLRREAERLVKEVTEVEIEEEIVKTFPITPEDIINIWNSVDASNATPELKRYIKQLSKAEKLSIIKEAFKGAVPEEVQRFARTLREKTGKKIKQAIETPATPENISAKYQELLRREIEARRLFSLETIKDELIKLTEWWTPYDKRHASKDYIKYRESSRELYAEALSVFLNSPGELAKRAPEFYRGFTEYLGRKPELLESFFELQDMLNGEPGELSEARAEQRRQMYATADQKIRATAAARQAAKGSWLERFNQFFSQMLVQRGAAVVKRARTGLKAGLDPVAENAYYAIQELAYAENVNHVMLNGINDILQPLYDLGVTDGDLGDWLFFQRVVNERNEIINPQGYTPRTAAEELEWLKGRFGGNVDAVQEGIQKLRDLWFGYVERAVEAEVYSQKAYQETLLPKKDTYATFAVTYYLQDNVPASLRKQTGTFQEIGNPLHMTIMKMVSMNRLAELNRAKRSVLELLKQSFPDDVRREPLAYQQKEPSKPAGPGREYLLVLEDGKPVYYSVPTEIAGSFMSHDVGRLARVGQFLQSTVYKVFHPLYVTFSPSFVAANPFRDLRRTWRNLGTIGHSMQKEMQDALVAQGMSREQAKQASKPQKITVGQLAWAAAKALPVGIRRARGITDPIVDEMLTNKALAIPFVQVDPEMEFEGGQTERLLQQHGIKQATGSKTWSERIKTIPLLGHIMGFMEGVGVVQETMTKVAGYRLLRERGVEPRKAAGVTRRYVGTPDFKQRGLATSFTNALWMYSNVRWQGLSADLELATGRSPMFKHTAAGFWWRAVVDSLLPTSLNKAALYGLFGTGVAMLLKAIGDDDEEWAKKTLAGVKGAEGLYGRIGSYHLENYDIIPLGVVMDRDGNPKTAFISIPDDDVGAMLRRIFSGIVDASLEATGVNTRKGNVETALTETAKSTIGAVIPNTNPALNQLARWGEYVAGENPKDSFTNREIVPSTEWTAGGWYRLKKMLSWTAGQYGVAGELTGLVLGQPLGTAYESGEQTWTETALSAPGLRRLIRITDRGLSEQQWVDVEAEDTARAELKLSLPSEARSLTRERAKLNRLGDTRLTKDEQKKRAIINAWFSGYYTPQTRSIEKYESTGKQKEADAIRDKMRTRAKAALEKIGK